MSLILFVCGTNRARSPMAAAYFASALKKKNITDIEVASAGIRTLHGTTVAMEARQVLATYDLEPLAVGTWQLLPKQVKSASLIVCMTDQQQDEILENFPSAKGKVRTLPEIIHSHHPIAEPPKGDLKAYENCLKQMIPALDELVERIQ